MEQKKTLWIVLAAGIFLLVVIGAAILLYGQQRNNSSSSAWVSPSISDSGILPSSGATTPDNLESEPEVSEDTKFVEEAEGPIEPTVDGVYLGQTAESLEAEPAEAAQSGTSTETITADTVNVIGTTLQITYTSQNEEASKAPEAIADAVPTAAPAAETKPASTTSASTAKPAAETKPASTSSSSASTEKSSTSTKPASTSTSSTSSTAPKSSTSKTAGTSSAATSSASKPAATGTASSSTSAAAAPAASYWVQAASYSTKKNADEARAALEASKLPCEVFTYKAPDTGTMYYRVRVGPYTTKTEAEYWQSKISAIKYFEGTTSYVTNSSAPASK